MATFTTNLTFSASGRLESSEFGTISVAGKRGSSQTFTPGDGTLDGDASANGNLDDVMAYDLTLGTTNARRFSGVVLFNLELGADVLDLGVRAANAGNPYTQRAIGNGGSGDDTLLGGTGDDVLRGEDAALVTLAASNDDRIFGNDGGDAIYGEFQNASLASTQALTLGADDLRGGVGNDTIFGDVGALSLVAGAALNTGDDSIAGGDGSDFLVGDISAFEGPGVGAGLDLGADTIDGGAGDDTIYGDSNALVETAPGGNDTITGGAGNDQLYGDSDLGSDFLTDDTFVFGPGNGDDTINDFQTGGPSSADAGGDIIDVAAYGVTGLAQLTLSIAGGDTTITGAALGTDSIRVANTTQLDASEFDFA